MKSTLKIICHWILVFIWAGMIFWMSSVPNLSPPADSFNILDFLLKKSAHLGEYFILTILILGAFLISRMSLKRAIVLSLALAVIYAVSDEWHQTFVVGRSGRIWDVVIDTAGVAAGIAFYYYRDWFFSIPYKIKGVFVKQKGVLLE